MDNLKLSKKQKPRQPIEGSEVPPTWIGPFLGGLMSDLKVYEIDKAKLKPEQNEKDEAEKTIKENSEEVEENQEQGN
jgi:hypothetical protein